MANLLDGRLLAHGISEVRDCIGATPGSHCLTDGRDCVWVYASVDAGATYFSFLTAYGANRPDHFLKAISEIFDTEIFDDNQPQFWGFDTQEEWDAWMSASARKSDEEARVEMIELLKDPEVDLAPYAVEFIERLLATKSSRQPNKDGSDLFLGDASDDLIDPS